MMWSQFPLSPWLSRVTLSWRDHSGGAVAPAIPSATPARVTEPHPHQNVPGTHTTVSLLTGASP